MATTSNFGMMGSNMGNPMGSSGTSSTMDSIAELIKEEFANTKDEKQAIENVSKRLEIADKSIVFFGFQGLLANTFSLIDSKEQEETKLRCFALDDTVSPVFMGIVEFFTFYSKYNVPDGTLNPVKIEDAMATLRLGEKMNRKEEKFEDSEVDEFDDDCTDDCIPGNHKCGK